MKSAFGIIHKANFKVLSEPYSKKVLVAISRGDKKKINRAASASDYADKYLRNTNKKAVYIGTSRFK